MAEAKRKAIKTVTITELLAPSSNQAFWDALVDEHDILASQGLILVSVDAEGRVAVYYRAMTGFTTIGVLTMAINGLIDD
jgi:hypothetical protein